LGGPQGNPERYILDKDTLRSECLGRERPDVDLREFAGAIMPHGFTPASKLAGRPMEKNA
jgi:hypothetical protein